MQYCCVYAAAKKIPTIKMYHDIVKQVKGIVLSYDNDEVCIFNYTNHAKGCYIVNGQTKRINLLKKGNVVLLEISQESNAVYKVFLIGVPK